jgi:CrcB protein
LVASPPEPPTEIETQAAIESATDREGAVMSAWLPYVLVGIGGFVGANARFIMARGVGALFETRFPLGTFIVNMSGSFLLGVLGTIIAQKVMPSSEAMRLALGVGFLGAFTTFSTFEFETHALFEDGSWLTATTNMFASLFVGLIALRAGIVVAKTWLS